MLEKIHSQYQCLVKAIMQFEGLAPLLLRLYLAPVFMQAGFNKLSHFEQTSQWFANPDWGLGLPFPDLLTALAGGTELVGGILLIPGIAVRLMSIPLMFTMLVAIFAVHWPNGWLAIADAGSWLANDRVLAAAQDKAQVISLLKEGGEYQRLTANASITMLNNGIEFAVTYFLMLLSLFFTGAGKYTSVDGWISCKLATQAAKPS